MKNKGLLILILVLILSITTLSGCTTKNNSSVSDYTKISSQEAKEMMENSSTITILDVRTEEEYKEGHIEGAILIPDTEILESTEDVLPDKSITILVYCRSGRRSESAAVNLSQLGYSNVYDMGGIIDWDYEIVTK